MSHIYKCTGEADMIPRIWTGEIKNPLTTKNTIEAEVTARNSYFHIILGHHCYGNYLCIPNWGIGIEMAEFDDKFWTREKLANNYPAVSKADIISIVNAVAEIGVLFDF